MLLECLRVCTLVPLDLQTHLCLWGKSPKHFIVDSVAVLLRFARQPGTSRAVLPRSSGKVKDAHLLAGGLWMSPF
jgi:hypothetical protein